MTLELCTHRSDDSVIEKQLNLGDCIGLVERRSAARYYLLLWLKCEARYATPDGGKRLRLFAVWG